MARRKVCVVVNSRANYGRIKSVLNAIKDHPALDLQLIAGASALLWRFGNVAQQIHKDGFNIDVVVYSIVEGENPTTMAKSTGMGIMELATQFENLRPHVVITVADRFETMATAIAASYMNIPLAHTQGGEVTGSIDESVRHAITKLAHIHFPATKKAKDNIIRMGEDPETVFLTGCPAIDIVADLDLTPPDDLLKQYKGVGPDLDIHKPYLVVLQHPVTTEYGSGFEQINETLKAIKSIRMQTVWLWPNVDAGSDSISKGLRMFRENEKPDYIHFYRHFSVEDYARLIANCACLVGNSSSGIREGSFLGVPTVDIGSRQSFRERARNCVNVGYNHREIEEAIHQQIQNGRYPSDKTYGDGKAGERIADILATANIEIQKRLMY
jgi:UDP-hydrolysing UDP-N-acetyl-D-glucosamine 2-epimerase